MARLLLLSSLIVVFCRTLTLGHPISSNQDSETEAAPSLLQSFGIRGWSQPEDHPAHSLFRRQSGSLVIGSDAWRAQYPSGVPDVTKTPQLWQDALTAAVTAGKIPNIPVTEPTAGRYPTGYSGVDKTICNSAVDCRGPDDIWDSPDGMIGISFDDGPSAQSPKLYDFLKANNQKATHFMIGSNILNNPKIMLEAFTNGDDIAVHTWTHPFMSSQTNEQIVAQIGWTMQIISDTTGGRIPRYWRPPYGDSDNRVRAIASGIFGLVQVNWNKDSADWTINTNRTTVGNVTADIVKWTQGPKHPGLMILEHEIYENTVDVFIAAYPSMKSNGWDTRSIPDLFDALYYQNAAGNTGTVTPMSNLIGGAAVAINSTSISSASIASSTAGPVATSTTAAAQAAATSTTSSSSALRFGTTSFTLISLSILSLVLLS